MPRMIRPRRVREGRGMGEKLMENLVFVLLGVAVLMAARWYLVTYKNSPTLALMNYVGAVKSGDVEMQYKSISSATKEIYPTKGTYTEKWKLAQGLHGRLVDYTITNITESGDKAEADVNVAIRKEKQEIYQAAATNVTDHYILLKEADGWKVALDLCFDKIKTLKYATERWQ